MKNDDDSRPRWERSVGVKLPESLRQNDDDKWPTSVEVRIGCTVCGGGSASVASCIDLRPSKDWFGSYHPPRDLDLRVGYLTDAKLDLIANDQNNKTGTIERLTEIDHHQSWWIIENPTRSVVCKLRNTLRTLVFDKKLDCFPNGVSQTWDGRDGCEFKDYYGGEAPDPLPEELSALGWRCAFIPEDETIVLCRPCSWWAACVHDIKSVMTNTAALARRQWFEEHEDVLMWEEESGK